MPGRKDFPRSYFTRNPFSGHTAEELYGELRWGENPNDTWELDAPEPMATLGLVARLDPENGPKVTFDERRAPFLAVGLDSNMLYIVPRERGGAPRSPVPSGPYHPRQKIRRIDYLSRKDGEDAYYYHDHERPYPTLAIHPDGFAILIPARTSSGRSYAVGPEGIIG